MHAYVRHLKFNYVCDLGKIVGMYQRCTKQKLPSDKVYRITHEKDNWYDKNVIAVKTSKHIVVAYLNRECAVTVASLPNSSYISKIHI
jgi:hypothetical protein